MNKIRTHYDILNVSRDAPHEVIRAAYKALAQKHHPDRHAKQSDAERIMMRINEAYDVLSKPEMRRKYDSLLGLQELSSTN